jgi:hypothetical protein
MTRTKEEEMAIALALAKSACPEISPDEWDRAYPQSQEDHTQDMYEAWLEDRISKLEKLTAKLELAIQALETF